MEPNMNETLICFIPKFQNAISIKNFRPIELCNISYKLVTKIIVNRIKPIFPSIIGPCQASFLSNRRASDNVIIVFRKIRVKKGIMILKIDLEKSFQTKVVIHQRHPYLFSFPANLVKLIISCVTTSFISILLGALGRVTPSPHTFLYSVWRGCPKT